jgi:beta-lactam-binding protein with PASTA domain
MGNGPRQPDDDEATLADGEWPVAEQYRVKPPTEPPAEEDRAVVIQDTAGQEPVRRFPPDLSLGLLLALIGALLVLVLVPAGLWLAGRDTDEPEAAPTTDTLETTPPTTGSTPTTPAARTVPRVTSLTLEEARELLEDVRIRVRRVSSDEPPSTVLEQAPTAGTRISPDLVVVLTVAKAATPEQVSVPDVEGLSAGEATAILREAGLQLTLRRVRSSEPEGTVVSQSPEPNEEVAPGTTVTLGIAGSPSPAPTPTTIEVPRLVGLTSSEARSQLRDLGLRFTQRPVESTRPKGTVVAQSPRPGARIRKGQAVTLSVSTGPARMTVPDVVGLDEQAARAELEAAGFEVEVVEQATDVVEEDGVVRDQSPAGGASRPEGSVVRITVSRFAQPLPSAA